MTDITPEQIDLFQQRLDEQDATHPGYAAAFRLLGDRLLREGGAAVVPPGEPDILIDMMLAQGAVVAGAVTLGPGDASSCHQNAARLWRSGHATGVGTGYALSDDGLWREHSWALADKDEVIETTVRREVYFGVSWFGDDAKWFADWVAPQTRNRRSLLSRIFGS